MHIVYATGSPRYLEFYLAKRREAVPRGATIFAICDGERIIENQDEDLFSAITDEEYFTLTAMVNQARRIESGCRVSSQRSKQSSLHKFFGWLFGNKSRRGFERTPT